MPDLFPQSPLNRGASVKRALPVLILAPLGKPLPLLPLPSGLSFLRVRSLADPAVRIKLRSGVVPYEAQPRSRRIGSLLSSSCHRFGSRGTHGRKPPPAIPIANTNHHLLLG